MGNKLGKVSKTRILNISDTSIPADRYLEVLSRKETPVAIGILSGKEYIITFANPLFCLISGKKHKNIINQPLWNAMPEVRGQGFEEILQHVLEVGIPYIGSESPVTLERNGKFETGYFSFVFTPIRNRHGESTQIMIIATEVTDKVLQTKAIQREREHFYEIFMNAPAVIGVLRGPKHIIDMVNPLAAQAIGIKRDVVGQSVHDALPEIESQGFIKILDTVYKTGKPFVGNETQTKVDVEGTGTLVEFYYNFVFQPDIDSQGKTQGIFIYAVDVTEEVLARRKIEENRQMLTNILESISDAFISYDKNWKFVYVNQEACKILGKRQKDLIGNIVWDIFPELKKTEAGVKILEAEKTGTPTFFQTYYKPFRKWFDVRVYPGKDGITTSFHDITESKILEQELTRLASLVAENNDAIWGMTIGGRIIHWNKGAETLYGYKANEILGKSSDLLVAKEKRKELKSNLAKIVAGKKIVNFETQRVRKDGKTIDVSVTISPIKNVRGVIIGISVIARNITAQKRIAEELQLSEQRFRTIIDRSTDVILLSDIEGNAIYVSDSAKRILGYTPEEMLGTDVSFYLHPEDVVKFYTELPRLLKKQRSQFTIEFRFKHKNGTWIWVESTGINHLENPAIKAIVVTIRDITPRKLLEKQKEEFLGIASHELKTPVTSLKAFTQVLHSRFSKKGDQKSVELLKRMNMQINKLTGLIQDLLDVSKVESGKLQLHKEEFPLDDLIAEVVEEIQLTIETHSIRIKGKINKRIYADRERIGQVLINFLTNAVKYSPQSTKVEVFSMVNQKSVTVCVEDFGIGISPKNLPNIFDRFFRVSEKKLNTVPGMGLGLNIASEIVKRHGGKIWAESVEGKGSRFCFSLPLKNDDKAGK